MLCMSAANDFADRLLWHAQRNDWSEFSDPLTSWLPTLDIERGPFLVPEEPHIAAIKRTAEAAAVGLLIDAGKRAYRAGRDYLIPPENVPMPDAVEAVNVAASVAAGAQSRGAARRIIASLRRRRSSFRSRFSRRYRGGRRRAYRRRYYRRY